MARNRIIYNVEGLYVAPYSGEQKAGSDYYLANNIILKRLEKIQNFNYSIQQPRSNAQGFGQKQNIFRGISGPPEVTFNFSYIPDGVTNENRLNFNVNHFSGFNAPMFSGLCTNSGLLNDRDFYLVINKDENDLFSENATLTSSLINPTNTTQIINSNSQNYGLLHFQNSYLNEYSFNVSLGNLPVVNQSYVADNIVFYNSGSGVKYTLLDLKSGINQTNTDTIIIPKNLNYTQSNLSGENILLPGDASVTFYRNPSHDSTNIVNLIPENITPTNMSKVGNTFTKTAVTSAWDSQAYSTIGYSNNMYVEATSLGFRSMFGLSKDKTSSASFNTIDYAWFFTTTSTPQNLQIYESGTDRGSFGGTYTASTKLRIEYDGKTVTYFKDGVPVRSVNVPVPNTTYYFDSSFYDPSASINANYGTLSNIQYYNDTIQSIDYSLSFNRKSYRAINYKFPLLRKMEFPVNGKLNTSFIVKEDFEGSFFDTLNRDDDYNIVVNFNNNNKPGVDKTQFTFSGCKFTNINYDSSIGANKTATLSFNFDLDPDFGRRGLFASGNVLYGMLNNTKKVLIF